MNRYAVSQLEQALTVVEANAPINRREGNIAQAQLEEREIRDFREAISKLRAGEKKRSAPRLGRDGP